MGKDFDIYQHIIDLPAERPVIRPPFGSSGKSMGVVAGIAGKFYAAFIHSDNMRALHQLVKRTPRWKKERQRRAWKMRRKNR